MEHKEDKIIDEIREILMNYELPYEEGAWESFNKGQEARLIEKQLVSGRSLWKLTVAAAAVLLLLLIKPLFKSNDLSNIQIDTAIVKTVEKEGLEAKSEIIALDPKAGSVNTITKDKPSDKESTPVESKSVKEIKILSDEPNVNLIAEVKRADSSTLIEKQLSGKNSESNNNSIIEPSVEAQGMISFNEDDGYDIKKEDNWRFGVELSSSFITDKVNFGAGLITEFKLSNKVSLATGVAFTKIDASNSIDPVGISSSTKKVGVESSMQALDIPLSVVYQVNNGFYASIGVSALTVLNENKAYQYETQTISESYVTDPKTGLQSTEYSIVREEYSAPTKETDLKGSSNIGYLNFSIGKKQSFYGKTQFLFEPFLKVPLGSLSNEEVRLMNGGLKIKLMF